MENVISIKKCVDMFDSDVEFMTEIIVLMRQDMVECLTIVSSAYNDNDTKGLQNVAHRIKGQAATIAADPLMKISKTVEDSARTGYTTRMEYLTLILRIKDFIKNTKHVRNKIYE